MSQEENSVRVVLDDERGIEAIRTDIASAGARLQILNGKVAELQQKMTELQKQKESLFARMSALKVEEKNFSSQLQVRSQLQSEDKQLQHAIELLTTEVAKLKSEVCCFFCFGGLNSRAELSIAPDDDVADRGGAVGGQQEEEGIRMERGKHHKDSKSLFSRILST